MPLPAAPFGPLLYEPYAGRLFHWCGGLLSLRLFAGRLSVVEPGSSGQYSTAHCTVDCVAPRIDTPDAAGHAPSADWNAIFCTTHIFSAKPFTPCVADGISRSGLPSPSTSMLGSLFA